MDEQKEACMSKSTMLMQVQHKYKKTFIVALLTHYSRETHKR